MRVNSELASARKVAGPKMSVHCSASQSVRFTWTNNLIYGITSLENSQSTLCLCIEVCPLLILYALATEPVCAFI